MPENITKTALHFFALNLKFLRKKHKITQDVLSYEVGVGQSVISDYERERAIPSLETALRISEYFDIGLGEMLDCDLNTFKGRPKQSAEQAMHGAKYRSFVGGLRRYENLILYCYYYSGEAEYNIREGVLTLDRREGITGSFVAGILKTNSQEYICKLVVEHPLYIYIFGENRINPERTFIVLHEPKYSQQNKPYVGGVGLCVSEGSSKEPYMQKILLSSIQLSIETQKDSIKQFLSLDQTDLIGFSLNKEDDKLFYKFFKNQRKSSNPNKP